MTPRSLSPEEALASLKRRFDAKWRLDKETGCWNWRGATAHGYGSIWSAVTRRDEEAHRVSYELYRGPIPAGLHLDHMFRCGRQCINPWHLEAVTQAENNRRSDRMVRLQRAKTHCPKGHPYDEANTYWLKNPRRRDCRTCMIQRARDRRRARRLAKGTVLNAEKTHCPKGHPYDESNTYVLNGKRYCRRCTAEHQRAYQRRRHRRTPSVLPYRRRKR